MKMDRMVTQHFRMWPRALFHMKNGREFIDKHLKSPGIYVLYRDDRPYYIGKTGKPLSKRLSKHALRPNMRHYNLWDYFSAFEIPVESDRDEIEAILISAMPTANSTHPKFPLKKLDRDAARMLNDLQAVLLTGAKDRSGESIPESSEEDEDE